MKKTYVEPEMEIVSFEDQIFTDILRVPMSGGEYSGNGLIIEDEEY